MTFPKSMKAAILVEQNKPLVIDQIKLPQTLEVGQVLVKILCSGICGSQLGEIDGAKGKDKIYHIFWVMRHQAWFYRLAWGSDLLIKAITSCFIGLKANVLSLFLLNILGTANR